MPLSKEILDQIVLLSLLGLNVVNFLFLVFLVFKMAKELFKK